MIGLGRRHRQRLLWPLLVLAFLAGIGSWCEPHAGEGHHHAVSASHVGAEYAEHESDTEPHCVPTEQTTSAARVYGDSFSPTATAAVLQPAPTTVPRERISRVGGRYLAVRPSPVQLFCIQRI